MAEVRWTHQAAKDLEAIADYIGRDSPREAAAFVADVLSAVDRAGSFPLSGRRVPESDSPSLREIILGNYRIIYRVRDEAVVILTIYHCARRLDPSRLE